MTVTFMMFLLRTLSNIRLSEFYSTTQSLESPILADEWDSLRAIILSGEADLLHLKRMELLETPFDLCTENQCFLICIAHDLLGYSEPAPASSTKPSPDAPAPSQANASAPPSVSSQQGPSSTAIRHEFLSSLLTGTCDACINGVVLLVELVETWFTCADVQLHFVGALREARGSLAHASLLAEHFRSSSLCAHTRTDDR